MNGNGAPSSYRNFHEGAYVQAEAAPPVDSGSQRFPSLALPDLPTPEQSKSHTPASQPGAGILGTFSRQAGLSKFRNGIPIHETLSDTQKRGQRNNANSNLFANSGTEIVHPQDQVPYANYHKDLARLAAHGSQTARSYRQGGTASFRQHQQSHQQRKNDNNNHNTRSFLSSPTVTPLAASPNDWKLPGRRAKIKEKLLNQGLSLDELQRSGPLTDRSHKHTHNTAYERSNCRACLTTGVDARYQIVNAKQQSSSYHRASKLMERRNRSSNLQKWKDLPSDLERHSNSNSGRYKIQQLNQRMYAQTLQNRVLVEGNKRLTKQSASNKETAERLKKQNQAMKKKLEKMRHLEELNGQLQLEVEVIRRNANTHRDSEFDELAESKAALQRENNTLRLQSDDLMKEKDKDHHEIQEHLKKIQELEELKLDKEGHIRDLEHSKERLKQTTVTLNDAVKDLEEEKGNLVEVMNQKKELIKEHLLTIERVQHENQELFKQKEDIIRSRADLRKQHNTLQKQHRTLMGETSKLRTSNASLKDDSEKKTKELRASEETGKRLKQQVNTLQGDCNELERARDRLQQEFDDLQGNSALHLAEKRREIEKFRNELGVKERALALSVQSRDRIQGELDALQKEHDDCGERVLGLVAQLGKIEEDNKKKETSIESLKAKLEALKQEFREEREELTAELSQARETAEADKNNALRIEEDYNTLKELHATCASKIIEAKAEVELVRRDYSSKLEQSNHQLAVEHKKYQHLEKEKNDVQDTLKRTTNRLDKSQAENVTLVKKYNALSAVHESCAHMAQQLKEKDQILNEIRTQLKDESEKLRATNETLDNKTKELVGLQVAVASAEKKLADLQISKTEEHSAFTSTREELQKVEKEKDELVAKLNRLNRQMKRASQSSMDDLAVLRNNITQLRSQNSELKGTIRAKTSKIEALEHSVSENEASLSLLEGDKAKLSRDVQDLQSKLAQARQNTITAVTSADSAIESQALSELKKKYDSLIGNMNTLQIEHKALQIEHAKFNGKNSSSSGADAVVVAANELEKRVHTQEVTINDLRRKLHNFEEHVLETQALRSEIDALKQKNNERNKAIEEAKKKMVEMKARVGVVYVEGPSNGVLVTQVKDNSPAQDCGLRDNDVIEEVNGIETQNMSKFKASLNHRLPGDSVPFQIMRNGKVTTLQLTLGAAGYSLDEVRRIRRLAESDMEGDVAYILRSIGEVHDHDDSRSARR